MERGAVGAVGPIGIGIAWLWSDHAKREECEMTLFPYCTVQRRAGFPSQLGHLARTDEGVD